MPTKSQSARRRLYRRVASKRSGSQYSSKKKKQAYKPSNKQKFINRSNPVSENKKIEATDIHNDVGLNLDGNPILNDFSKNPRYLGNEVPLDNDPEQILANYPTGARGYPLLDATWNFNPDSCLYQTQGTDNNSMIGSSCYQRLCAAKFLIRWPQPSMNTGKLNSNADDYPVPDDPTDPTPTEIAAITTWLGDPANNHMGVIPEVPQSYHLYWGFVKTPTGYSDFTDPKRDEASVFDLENHINLRVEQWFNQRTDRLEFIPKVDNNLKIIGKKKLRPPWDSRNGRLPVSYTEEDTIGSPREGVIPDTMVKIKWPINKKIHFQETNNFSGDGVTDAGNPVSGTKVYYQNHNKWLPFAVIVNWNAATLPKNVGTPAPGDTFTSAMVQRTIRVPHVLVNDITYYRDS